MELSSDTVHFGAFVLAHCAAIAATNEPGDLICPFVVIAKDGKREIVDFESETQEEAVSKGWEHLEKSRSSVDYWTLGREGYFSFAEGKSDVLVMSVWKLGMPEPISLLHRFSPKGDEAFYLRGNIEILIEGKLFSDPTHPFFARAVQAGISSHPKGDQWSSWLKG